MSRWLARMCLFLAASSAGVAWAQTSKDINNNIDRAKSLWDPQVMMKEACDGIAKHYKLDAKQSDFTCKLLTKRVTRFLEKHDKQLWPLLWELTEQQMAGKEPQKDAAQRIASKGYPIFEDARAEIMSAQDEFRKILNEEQKKIHDRDLKGLRGQFRSIDRRLKNWREGKAGGRPPMRIGLGPPGTKVRPLGGGRRPASRNTPESRWEKYVRAFVFNYRLHETQKVSAMAIFQDLKDQAGQYRKSHHKELVEAEALVREAQLAKPFDKNDLQQAKRIRYLLNKPFEDWFNELKSRLDQIPTEKQRADLYARSPHLKPGDATRPSAEKPAKSGDQPPKPRDPAKKQIPKEPAEKKQTPAEPKGGKGQSKPSNP